MSTQIIDHDVTIPASATGEPVTVRLQLEVTLPDDCACQPQPISLGNPRGWKP